MSKKEFREKLYDIRVSEIASDIVTCGKLELQLSEMTDSLRENHKHLYQKVYKMDGVRAYRTKDKEGKFTDNWKLSIRVDNPFTLFDGTPWSYRNHPECTTEDLCEYMESVFKEMGIEHQNLYWILEPVLVGNHVIIDITHPSNLSPYEFFQGQIYGLMFAAYFVMHKRKTFAQDVVQDELIGEIVEKYRNRKELGDDAWQAAMYRTAIEYDWYC